jgi:PAS domain S-box-containing protein
MPDANRTREDLIEELRRRDATIRAFFESASEGIVAVDRDGRISLVNPRGEFMFGYERGELLGQSVEILLPERSRLVHRGHRGDYFARPRARSMGLGLGLTGRRKDGTEFPIEVSLSFLPDEAGGIAMAFVTDISQRVAQERHARHVEKLVALGSLAAGIAHEINNPIGILQSRIELMLMDVADQGASSQMEADLQALHRQAVRLARIAQGLLSFSRQPSGRRGPVDVNHLLEETLLLIERPMIKQGVKVTRKLAPNLPPVWGDSNSLQQVVLNLLTNARDAVAGGGEICVETSHPVGDPDMVRLRVRDSGPGIEPETLPRIFEPFFTTKSNGTGLGLSISYGIVQEHHGTVDVQSRPHEGTTFILTLPVKGARILAGGEA